MNKTLRIIMVFWCTTFVSLLFSQANENLIKAFIRGNISEKTELISSIKDSSESNSELYIVALAFIYTNYSLLSQDSDFIEFACTVVQKIEITQEQFILPLLPLLENLFLVTKNSDLQIDLLTIFSSIGTDNESIVDLVNAYTIELFASDDVDKNTKLLLAVDVLANFAHISSFPVLFNCYTNTDDKALSLAVVSALEGLDGSYENQLQKLIESGNSREKNYAFKLVLDNDKNSDFFKAEMSEKLLSNTIYSIGDVLTVDSDSISLQMAAIQELQRISWTRSADLVRDFFLLARKEYDAGLLSDEQFVEVIHAFTSLSSIEAGMHLSAYLKELNMANETNTSYSKPVVLAVIQSLGLLGDKVAFDALLYTTYLDYSEDIVLAAKEALGTLKW